MIRVIATLAFAAAFSSILVPASHAQDDAERLVVASGDRLNYENPPRKQDEAFLVNTRSLGEPEFDDAFELPIQRFNESGTWEPLSSAAFHGDDKSDSVTLIYVHGYDFDERKALRVGWACYHALCDDLEHPQRLRHVIWSWPTKAKRFRPSRDVADKALRADIDAYYLAMMLQRMPSDRRVCLIASALGCRVAEGALHLLGGGELSGWKLDLDDVEARPQISTVFISPAVHDDWLYDGQFHDRALVGTDQLLLINNSRDPILRRYTQLWRSQPRALGLDGVVRLAQLDQRSQRIKQYDAHEEIGEHHGVENYLRNEAIVRRLQAFAFD